MLKQSLLLLFFFSSVVSFSYAQETSYFDKEFNLMQKPAYPQCASYTTFDMGAISVVEDEVHKMDLPYQIKLGDLKQVESSTDFHIVSVLSKFSGKLTSLNSMTANIYLTTYVYDKFGNLINAVYTSGEAENIIFNKSLDKEKEENKNQDLIRQRAIEKVTQNNLKKFLSLREGATQNVKYELGGIVDFKKFPELAEVSKVSRTIKDGLDISDLQKALEPNVPYWEKLLEYNGGGDTTEVKRAAYQNLSVYHIVAGNTEKAMSYIEKYKQIDKVHKQMMGLLKVIHSENCEKMINLVYPPLKEIDETAPVVTLQQVKDNIKYVTINGSITVDTRKNAGTYTYRVDTFL